MLAYAATLTPDKKGGGYVVIFRDVPEGITQGETLDDALHNAADALTVALEFYAERKQRFPKPSKPRAEEHPITLPLWWPPSWSCIGGCARRARLGWRSRG